MISSLPGKASRMIVKSRALPSDSKCVFESEPGKLNIKRPKRGIPGWFTLQVWRKSRFSCRFNVMDDIMQKVKRHDDLIKTHAVR